MCGIVGILEPISTDNLSGIVQHMTDQLTHRGPDSHGVWADAISGVALGHRRLSIIDQSSAGHQPMESSCERIIVTYNGEIYNASELRSELLASGRVFRGRSDTEVLVEGIAEWGLETLLPRLVGMFAFAVWDRQSRCLSLVRDRFGIKPLYWSFDQSRLLFGSELKALTVHPNFDRELDRNAVAAYLRFGYVPSPQSIYRRARKLDAGKLLEIRPGEAPVVKSWWRLSDVIKRVSLEKFSGNEIEAARVLDELLRDSVSNCMISDVPIGSFLSGGIDSSTVTALMQAQSDRSVKTFTIGFEQFGYNEAMHARAVAEHLETDHHEMILTPKEALEAIPKLPEMFDEPFADISQIPMYLVSLIASKHIKVALSGDGGDEFFAGYNRYKEAAGRLRWFWALPKPIRDAMARGLNTVPPRFWSSLIPHYPNVGEKMQKLATAISAGQSDFYKEIVSIWDAPTEVISSAEEDWASAWGEAEAFFPDPVERMQYLDTLTYMTDDILTKVDRASMIVALETRVPVIDHRIGAFAWSLPLQMKLARGRGKRVLRRVLSEYVPRGLIERPKQGFSVPMGDWLRSSLKDWAGDVLSNSSMRDRQLLCPRVARTLWSEHQAGTRDHSAKLWAVIVLNMFLTQSAR